VCVWGGASLTHRPTSIEALSLEEDVDGVELAFGFGDARRENVAMKVDG
jgi:hypothetical protein